MGIGRKRGPGGGGASLNFDVKAYPSEEELLAAVPKENTIGIITTTPITSWFFDAVEPETVADGMVWFPTGTSGAVEFNALKKNGIQVYPLSAKQYVSGAWVGVTAKSYQNGEWLALWNGELYMNGKQYEDVTGGWTTNLQSQMNCTFTDEGIEFKALSDSGNIHGTAYTKKKIDITNYSTIFVDVVIPSNPHNRNAVIGISSSVPENIYHGGWWDAVTVRTTTGRITLDVSSYTGEYYVWVNAYGISMTATDVFME